MQVVVSLSSVFWRWGFSSPVLVDFVVGGWGGDAVVFSTLSLLFLKDRKHWTRSYQSVEEGGISCRGGHCAAVVFQNWVVQAAVYSFCHQCPAVARGHRKHAWNTAWLSSCPVLSHGSDLFTPTLLAYLRFLTSDYASMRFLHWLQSVIFHSEFCFSLMFHSTFLLPAHWDCHFHIQLKMFCLRLATCQIVAQKGRHTKWTTKMRTTRTSKAASLVQKKKSGPTRVKLRYVQERLPQYVAVSSFLC